MRLDDVFGEFAGPDCVLNVTSECVETSIGDSGIGDKLTWSAGLEADFGVFLFSAYFCEWNPARPIQPTCWNNFSILPDASKFLELMQGHRSQSLFAFGLTEKQSLLRYIVRRHT